MNAGGVDGPLDTAPCGFLSFTDDGTIIAINSTLLRLLGRERHELLGSRIESIFSAAGRVFYQTHFFPLIKLQSHAEEIYLSLRSASGGDVPVLAYATRRQTESGEVTDCIFARIGNRDRYENEILAARRGAESALAAEREAAQARERLVGILGHDLRVPLTAVTLGADELIRSGELSEERQQTALAILSSARRAARMVTDLLDFTRARFTGGIPIRRRPADLCEVARKVFAEITAGGQQHRVQLVTEGDCHGSWDPDRAAQVVANLVRNALEHGRDDSAAVVRIEGRAEDVVIEVENAIHAVPEDLGDIFSPFRQGRARTGGLGLGLFIVQQIVMAHEGTVRASGADGRFVVTTVWPRAAQDEPDALL